MSYPLPGITVNPGVGKSMSVNIQTNTPVSATPTVYSDRYGLTSVTLPAVITAPTTFYVPNPGTWIVNGQPITVEGTQIGYVNNAASLNGTVFAPPPTGVAATDMANVQTAINSVPNATGIVQLQGGKYAFASTLRTDTVTVSNGSKSWADTSCVASDLGSYVLSYTHNTAVPQIIAVQPGVGFTTDIATGALISATAAFIVKPGVVVPYGIRMQGIGRFSASQFESPSASTSQIGTRIVDTGTGVSILARGSMTYGGDGISLGYMGIWGSDTGTVGSTFCGVYLGDNNWFGELERIDLSWHGTAGLIMDANLNSLDSHNSSYQNNGTIGATTATGGVLLGYYQQQTSACINFYNDFFFNNYGMGIGAGPITGGIANVPSVINSQVANTNATSFSTYSGIGIVCRSNLSGAQANLLNVWVGTNAVGDLWLNAGAMEAINCTFTSPINTPITTYGALSLRGCQLYSTNTTVVSNNGQVNWSACTLNGSATNLYSGGPNAAQCLGAGSSIVSYQPAASAVTVTTNAGTVPVGNTVSTFTNTSAATMAITMAVTGAVDGQISWVQIYDFSAAAETIGWTNTENSTVSAPTTSNGSTTLPKTVEFMFNGATSKWRTILSV